MLVPRFATRKKRNENRVRSECERRWVARWSIWYVAHLGLRSVKADEKMANVRQNKVRF